MDDAAQLHADATIVDAACPGSYWRAHHADWRAGGASCCALTVATTTPAREALRAIAQTYALIRSRPDELALATTVEQIRAAKRAGRLAVVLHFQGAEALEYEPALVEAWWRLGVRVIQLAYNRRNPLCDGCEEPADAGLSALGREVVAELARVGIVLDVSHTGRRSSLEAIAAGPGPVVASHANAAAVHASPRNLDDELIRALAGSGGVIGIAGFPSFVSASSQPTLDQLIDHAAHVAGLVGAEHVGLGLDYFAATRAEYDARVADGRWSPAVYGPPPYDYPAGIEDPSGLPRLTARLLERGFAPDEVRGILGENWLRVYGAVWEEQPAAG